MDMPTDVLKSVKRTTPASFQPRTTPSGSRRAMTEAEIEEFVARRLREKAAVLEAEAKAEAARITVPTGPIRHLNDQDIVLGVVVAVRVSGKFERGKVLDRAQMQHTGRWVYDVQLTDQIHDARGRVRGLSIKRSADLYPESILLPGVNVEPDDVSDE